ncbi:shikimate dehydrogenase [Leucobacter sp. wl10]|uniref:shikimate dehydrogenase n=1 Tax=Leucobacter sp. wl10 TaxID=2304677 RepID=UPI000E5B3FD3|nr:shikimate dehydrogenase [Leucobacter sp. wl10]RGE22024.1 shikimate dehydrogenase [Leucobacter sp. wl10]
MVSPAFLVGLVGTGTIQSLSPALHMAEGRAHGLSHVFRPIDIAALGLELDQLPEILDWSERLGYNAMTVTHPCKQQVIDYLDRVDPVAAELGAVNTVVYAPEGRVGYNTDTTGFEHAFRDGMGDATLRRVVQLGAGGAGTAVADALVRLGAEQLTIVDIDEYRSSSLAADLRGRRGANAVSAPHAELTALLAEADGVVHCTPQGMHDHPGAPFDTALLRSDLWVADIVYRPLETELLRAARATGCTTLAGGRMAVYQAVDAFRLITGVEPDAERMMRHFRELAAAEGVA